MITLITATPGSGKSLYAVSMIRDFLNEGRQVYADINGLTLDVAGESPDDWRDTPEGSVVVYDEAQKKFPSTGRPGATGVTDVLRDLETHRHTGHDIIFITQNPTFLHSHIRKLVGQHYHLRRIAGSNSATLFKHNEEFDVKKIPSNVDKQIWLYPKDLFACYKSATIHTHKFKMPTIFKVIGVALVLLFGFSGYKVATGGLFGSSSDDASEPVSSAKVVDVEPEPDLSLLSDLHRAIHLSASQPSLPGVSACRIVESDCLCYDPSGSPMSLTPAQCQLMAYHAPIVKKEDAEDEEDSDVASTVVGGIFGG